MKRWHTTHRILGGKYNVIVVYPARDINSARVLECQAIVWHWPEWDRAQTHNIVYGIWMFYIYMNVGIPFSPFPLYYECLIVIWCARCSFAWYCCCYFWCWWCYCCCSKQSHCWMFGSIAMVSLHRCDAIYAVFYSMGFYKRSFVRWLVRSFIRSLVGSGLRARETKGNKQNKVYDDRVSVWNTPHTQCIFYIRFLLRVRYSNAFECFAIVVVYLLYLLALSSTLYCVLCYAMLCYARAVLSCAVLCALRCVLFGSYAIIVVRILYDPTVHSFYVFYYYAAEDGFLLWNRGECFSEQY